MIFKERYREPTLELVLPTMLVSNVFLSAFYERGGFSLLGVVLSMVPVISVSETLAFSLGLRNVIFVTGDHLYNESIISFLTTPVRREELFAFIYFSDVVVPVLLWAFTTALYSLLSGVPVPPLLALTFVVGYFFAENLVLLLTLVFKSPGVSTLVSIFVLGGVFVFGDAGEYFYALQGEYGKIFALSFTNPFVPWIITALGKDLYQQVEVGVAVDGFIAALTFVLSFLKFRGLEV
ncbi:MAG: hypothetical protein ASUL_04234 [Candidatus Aramenus sulfurataquae]|uniref:Uncharacterized protein n=3 Tax=Candidatus Aramenus sulfurataquae TaxID=1326980 RepID=W7KK10_9CREN|nr:MAG: hypothetical protein ASUL_04234 [Candidatus Aramenus sulfurataquae]